MGAVARMEATALPVSRFRVDRFVDHWDDIRRFYIKRDDTHGLWDDLTFRESRLADLVLARSWNWPRTDKGHLAMDFTTWRRQAQRHPELKTVSQLRTLISDLRMSALANTIGRDSRSRCSLMPFWTKTGRNQPWGADKIFLPALPAWIHGVIAPPPGWGMAEIDYSAQEILIMAALSGDQAMIDDYMAGDPYLAYGIRAGLIPEDATDKHPLRKACKEVCLGMDYGMTAYGIKAKTGKTLMWSRDAHRRHRYVYHVFHEFIGDVVTTAKFTHRIATTFNWPMAVTDTTARRALMNYLAQGGAGDMLRIATIAATEAGLHVCCPIHDAVWIMAPLRELDTAIERMREFMRRASMAVTGGYAARTKVEYTVRYPQCLGDVRAPEDRGQALWLQVNELVDSGQLRRASYG
jgi:DNA polymerase-1